jgi:hypothetical protein
MVQAEQSAKALAEAVAEVEVLPKDELRRRWVETFKTAPPPRASREFLERSLAHRVQEQTLGGLTPKVRKRLAKLVGAFEKDPSFSPAPEPSFKPGTRLIREWKGEIHEVEVLEKGFSWRGNRYGNLSRIAREITGTRWSGPLFFGLKKRPARTVNHGQ